VARYSAFLDEKGLKEDLPRCGGRRLGDLLNALPDIRNRMWACCQPAVSRSLILVGWSIWLGIKWAEMGHASGRAQGMTGHSAFNCKCSGSTRPAIMLPPLTDRPTLSSKSRTRPVRLYVLQGLWDGRGFATNYVHAHAHGNDC